MKKLFLLLFAISMTFVFGCSQSGQKSEAPQATPAAQQAAPAQAPAPAQQPESAKEIVQQYGQGLVKSVDKARGVQGKIDLDSVKDAVRNYQVENGRYPASLDAIKNYVRPDIDLTAFNYDPATGNVTQK